MFYLNTIKDLFNRDIVALCIETSPDAELCVSKVMKLKKVSGTLKGMNNNTFKYLLDISELYKQGLSKRERRMRT